MDTPIIARRKKMIFTTFQQWLDNKRRYELAAQKAYWENYRELQEQENNFKEFYEQFKENKDDY